MNKILKIIIKANPIFKYIVEDYPFYQGLFFHLIDFHIMDILKTHYLLRRNLKINEGKTQNLYIPKLNLRLTSIFKFRPSQITINTKFNVRKNLKLGVLNILKICPGFNLRLKMNDKNYIKSIVNIHIIRLIKLKTHDPYALENRDILSLSSMDGEKIL